MPPAVWLHRCVRHRGRVRDRLHHQPSDSASEKYSIPRRLPDRSSKPMALNPGQRDTRDMTWARGQTHVSGRRSSSRASERVVHAQRRAREACAVSQRHELSVSLIHHHISLHPSARGDDAADNTVRSMYLRTTRSAPSGCCQAGERNALSTTTSAPAIFAINGQLRSTGLLAFTHSMAAGWRYFVKCRNSIIDNVTATLSNSR